jgi:alpha/beta superfamily hydrolase
VSTERIVLPGTREIRASLDADDGAAAGAVLVACPPHPERGGTRHDARLGAVSAALPERIDCLRFDYGPWDGGRGACGDARTAVAWAADRYERVGLFGYSVGGGVALLVAATAATPDAVAALAPVVTVGDGRDVTAAVPAVDGPLWVGYGTDDDVVDAAAVADAAHERGGTVASFAAGHGFVGRERAVGERVAAFVDGAL